MLLQKARLTLTFFNGGQGGPLKRARQLGIQHYLLRIKDKLTALEQSSERSNRPVDQTLNGGGVAIKPSRKFVGVDKPPITGPIAVDQSNPEMGRQPADINFRGGAEIENQMLTVDRALRHQLRTTDEVIRPVARDCYD